MKKIKNVSDTYWDDIIEKLNHDNRRTITNKVINIITPWVLVIAVGLLLTFCLIQ